MTIQNKKVFYLLCLYLAIFFLPYIGALIRYDGTLPSDFFQFPPVVAGEKAGFNLTVFITISIIFLVLILFYLTPKLFGFKKYVAPPKPPVTKARLPIWFWVGLLMWAPTLFIMWSKMSEPKWVLNWVALPLYWGFTLMIDGWVYKRTGGKSILSTSIQRLIGIGVASIAGWLIFEYLNFFVAENWVYPKADLIPVAEFTIYAVIGSSGLLPLVFEWYSLFNTFGFVNKYKNGPKIVVPAPVNTFLLVVMFAGLFFISFYPDGLFGLLWMAPMFILAIGLDKIGIWTPFTPLKKGNWAPMMIFALSYLVQGFLCECWNYMSASHDAAGNLVETYNPDYWTYSVPYVNVLHVFEMPLLGFSGYLPFGVYCAIWWISFSCFMNIPTDIHQNDHQEI